MPSSERKLYYVEVEKKGGEKKNSFALIQQFPES